MDYNASVMIPSLRARITQGACVGRYDDAKLELKVMKITKIRRNGTLDVVVDPFCADLVSRSVH